MNIKKKNNALSKLIKFPTFRDYKLRTITADRTWLHCKGYCLNAYETTDPLATSNIFKPTMGSIYDSEYIGHYYLCPECDKSFGRAITFY